MDVRRRFLAAGNVELAAARRARTDEDRIPALRQQRLEAVDAPAAVKFDAEVEDIVAFLVDDRFRQTEARNLRADHAAGLGVLVEHHAVIAERRQVARDRKRGGAAAHERDVFAILGGSRLGQAVADVVLEVGRHPFEAADRDRLALPAPAGARRLGRAVGGVSLEVAPPRLEAADRARLFPPAPAPARWFARPVAGAPED